MKRRRGILLAILGVGLAAALLLVLWPEGHGPVYEGRALETWLDYADIDDDPNPEALHAVEVVRRIGTNALPFLVEWINYHPSKWRGIRYKLVPKSLWIRAGPKFRALFHDSREFRAEQAEGAFAILGEQATPAIPALTNLFRGVEGYMPNNRALRALSSIGTNGVEVVLEVVTNSAYTDTMRFVALECINNLETNANWTIPALVTFLNDPEMGPQVSVSLGKLKAQPELVVPALARCLHSSQNLLLPESAAESLGKFGTQAVAAVPDLVWATTNAEKDLRIAATNALLSIAPEVLAKESH